MAIFAQQTLVCAFYFEISIFVVVKFDSGPLFIVMTLMALNTPVTVMNIFKIVAEVAVFRCFDIPFVYMTILATNFEVGISFGSMEIIDHKGTQTQRLVKI